MFPVNPASPARRRPRGGSNSPHLIDNQAASPDAYKGNTIRCEHSTDVERWNRPGSNRPPLDCQSSALPDELRSQDRGGPEEPPIEVGVDHVPPIRLCGGNCGGQRPPVGGSRYQGVNPRAAAHLAGCEGVEPSRASFGDSAVSPTVHPIFDASSTLLIHHLIFYFPPLPLIVSAQMTGFEPATA